MLKNVLKFHHNWSNSLDINPLIAGHLGLEEFKTVNIINKDSVIIFTSSAP